MLNEINLHLTPTIESNRIITRYTIKGFPGLSLIAKLLIPFIIRRLKPDNLTVTAKHIIYKIPPIISKFQIDIKPLTITIKRR
jgi:predicted ATP-grasp superfamily ATP-dependent carboligase